jgi:hypothetical protein
MVKNNTAQSIRDVPKVTIQLATLLATALCAYLASADSLAWIGWMFVVLLVGVSLAPSKPPGTPARWQLADSLCMAVALGAVPAGITLAVLYAWWWLLVAGTTIVVFSVLANELDKPKAGPS